MARSNTDSSTDSGILPCNDSERKSRDEYLLKFVFRLGVIRSAAKIDFDAKAGIDFDSER